MISKLAKYVCRHEKLVYNLILMLEVVNYWEKDE